LEDIQYPDRGIKMKLILCSKIIALNLIIYLIVFSGILYAQRGIERYKIFELELDGSSKGNPFRDVRLKAAFQHSDDIITVAGFYDGNGKYRIRFMPHLEGEWNYTTESNNSDLDNIKGSFMCIPAAKDDHGIVRVYNTFHFKYDDGKQFYPFGTTIYAWTHQPGEIQEQTLETLSKSPFNKVRMCVFPKWYEFNRTEPEIYPYPGSAPDNWNFQAFNTGFFRQLENRIARLNDLGIQCDLILFHPYDGGHWGFDRMSDDQDDFYLRYVIARLSAFQNIWWSLANEFDFMEEKQEEDWDRFLKILHEEDPYGHLRSIHNGARWYDQSNPLITHLSIQQDPWEDGGVGEGPQKIDKWKEKYRKPVIMDEMKYEGDIRYSFGDLTGKEMTRRFWYTVTKGAYATHGETYMNKEEIIWWSKGGKLVGSSPERIAFLRNIIEEAPSGGFEACLDMEEDGNTAAVADDTYLIYFGARQPSERLIKLSGDKSYTLELIDTWNMTIEQLEGTYSGECFVRLPAKPYMAVRAKVISN
jgi:hypothetical protein